MGHNLNTRVKPRDFAWCGDDSVVLYWRTVGMILFNSFADWMKFTYDKDDTLFLVTECDSLRVYSSLKHEIIRRVPDPIVRVYTDEFSCGSALRTSHAHFVSHRGDVQLPQKDTPEDRSHLRDGVLDCLDAAENELSTLRQEELLRSARFGKCFLDGEELEEEEMMMMMMAAGEEETEPAEGVQENAEGADERATISSSSSDPMNSTMASSQGETTGEMTSTPEAGPDGSRGKESTTTPEGGMMVIPSIESRFREVTHTLRVLHALCDPQIAMFLTCQQYYYLGPTTIIRRLLCRHHYFLALKICAYLDLSPDFVLIDWASQKIIHGASLSDEEIRDQIRENLKMYKMISYKEIAEVANKAGRTRLATMLLEFEPHHMDRVSGMNKGYYYYYYYYT